MDSPQTGPKERPQDCPQDAPVDSNHFVRTNVRTLSAIAACVEGSEGSETYEGTQGPTLPLNPPNPQTEASYGLLPTTEARPPARATRDGGAGYLLPVETANEPERLGAFITAALAATVGRATGEGE